ncbi:MAG TPA: trigger factor [Gemmataceae bacterium]|nr:trigger factor [Gemmataceae bacterium]
MTDEPREEDAASATIVEPMLDNDAEGADADKPAKLTQTVELKDIGPCKKHIRVSVDRADLDKRLQDKFKELVVDSNVAGFRPGKAPRKIVEKRYQKEVGDQVKAEVLLQSLEQLADEHDVAPLSAPNIDPFKIELPKEGPLVYEFEVEVRPQFDLPSYKNLKIRRPVHTYSDEEVASEKRRILAPHGQIVPKESGSVEVGDIITTDITSRDGDRLLNELKELTVRVEPRLAFKDGVAEKFGEQVSGAKAGDKRVVDLTLSTSVSDPTLQGKTVKATFDIKDVKMLRLPELTHAFLHEFGVHTEDQLDELVRVVLQRRLEYQQRQSAREQVLGQIAAASSWELPHDLLIRQARKSLARRIMEMRSEGIAEEEIRGRQRILEQDILQSTALALKEHFVLQKIAEVEKIDVDEDDLNDEIERIADQYQESARRVRARLEKEDMMEALAAELIERKALDLILDSAEYEDVALDTKKDSAVGTIEEQGVPGEMQDLTTPPPAEEQSAREQS